MKIILPIMLVSLSCTIVLEMTFAFVLGLRYKKDFLNVFLVNLLTNPIVVSFSFICGLLYGNKGQLFSTIFLELFAFLSEGFIYTKVLKYKKLNGFVLSLILNGVSYGIGIIINNIVWG